MSNRVAFLLLMGFGVALEVAGDVLLKKWAGGHRWIWLATGFILYTLGTVGWAWSLRYETLSKAAIVFMVANMALAILAGHFLFGERLTTWNWVGAALAVVSIVLCEL